MTIFVYRGLPGSGKTTAAIQDVRYSTRDTIRVNRDDIRAMIGVQGGIGDSKQEALVTEFEDAAIKAGVEAGYDVVVDATNLNNKFVRRFFKMGAPVEFVDFPIPVHESIIRDSERGAAGGREVGAAVIEKMAQRYKIGDDGVLPSPPRWDAPPKPDLSPAAAWDNELPTAIIVDTDGTMANHEGIRNVYDTSRYALDTVHENVAQVVAQLGEVHHVIAVSGRDAAFSKVTGDWWLAQARIEPDEMYFRPEGDRRPDDVIKAEIYEQHIRGRYNVVGIFDDRGRVLRMWRAKGLTTFAVGDTDNYNF